MLLTKYKAGCFDTYATLETKLIVTIVVLVIRLVNTCFHMAGVRGLLVLLTHSETLGFHL